MAGDYALNGKTLVLTGAGGFLGRHLLPLLLREGARVAAVTSRTRGQLCSLADIGEAGGRLRVVDARKRQDVSEALVGADFLVNAGFPRANEGHRLAEGMDFIDWLFREAAARGIGAVVNVSSQSVYDQHRAEPATEETLVCPQSPYAVAKYATELMLNGYCPDIPHTSIRLASLIGPGFDQRVVNKMIKSALDNQCITVSNRNDLFCYLDILDAIEAITEFLSLEPSEWHRVYNLGPISSMGLFEIANLVQYELSQIDITVSVHIQQGSGISTQTPLDSQLFRSQVGWCQMRTIGDSIERIVQFELTGRCSL